MVLPILLALIIFILAPLVVPIKIVLQSNNNNYYINLWGYFKAQLTESGSNWKVKIRFFFIPLSVSGSRKKWKGERNELKPTKAIRNKKKTSLLKAAQLGLKLLKSVRIDRLRASIDTGNYPLNAQLIPLTQAFQGDDIRININFFNYNSIDFQASTYAYKIVWTLLKTYLFTKNSNHGK